MNQPLRALAIAASLLLLAGCNMLATTGRFTPGMHNESPVAINFPEVYQPKFQAMQHWQAAAENFADAIQRSLQTQSECRPNHDCRTVLHARRPCTSIGCATTQCETSFGQVFHSLLEAALAKRGFRLTMDEPAAGLVLTTEIQAVRFAADRPQFRAAGELVKLGEGVWALRDVAYAHDTVKGVPLEPGSRLVPNWFKAQFAAGDTPAHELMVAVAASDQSKTMMSKIAAVYYVADQDSAHYLCPAKTVTAPSPAPKPSTNREVRVLGDCTEGRCTQPARPNTALANPIASPLANP